MRFNKTYVRLGYNNEEKYQLHPRGKDSIVIKIESDGVLLKFTDVLPEELPGTLVPFDYEAFLNGSMATLTEKFCLNRGCNMCLHQFGDELLCSVCHSHRPIMQMFTRNSRLGTLQHQAVLLRIKANEQDRALYRETAPQGAD